MSRIRANTIVDSAATGAPTFPNGAIINGNNLTIGTGTTISNPSDNEFRILTNGSERVREGSGGSVGIGTDDPTRQLEIFDSTQATLSLKSSSTGQSSIWLADTDDTNIGGVYYQHTNDALVMRTNDSEAARFNSSGNLAFPSGQGIDFSATADGSGTTTSELLDDYEEGEWTPIFADSSGAQASQTYSVQRGRYVKVGRHLTCTFDVQLSAKGTFGGSYITLGGLPYSTTQGVNCGGTLTIGYYSGFSLPAQANVINGYVNSGNVYLMTPRDANGSDYITTADSSTQINNDSRIIGTINIMLDV